MRGAELNLQTGFTVTNKSVMENQMKDGFTLYPLDH